MKKIFRKFFTLIFVGLMLFSLAFFGIFKNEKEINHNTSDDSASALTFENSNAYVENLLASTESIESKYNLADYYPLISENQSDSSFCWIYSSMKSLEASLMVQKQEYYNFSEMALAYLYFLDRTKTSNFATFNTSGNFETFAECYQKYGLVLESDFSNSEYKQIDRDTCNDYLYVQDLTSKELGSTFTPYLLGVNSAFDDITLSKTKIGVVKRFIKKYGALFAGIEGGDSLGCFYYDNNATDVTNGIYQFYDWDRTAHKDKGSYIPLTENHAITIVGWNDDIVFDSEQGAFLVMNSWGFEEKSINLFYIPYSYTNILYTTRGFICKEDAQEKISIESSSESTFTNEFMKGSKEIKNFFAYDNEVWVNYKLEIDSFDKLEIEILSGEKSYKGLFSVTSDNNEKTIKVKLNDAEEFYGGYYSIGFYHDGALIGKRGIYIYSGTEINYFKGRTESKFDMYLLDNAFVNTDNIVNINASSVRESGGKGAYYLEFRRAPISSFSFIEESNKVATDEELKPKEISMNVKEIEVISSKNKALESAYDEDTLKRKFIKPHLTNDIGNLFRLQIGDPVNGIPLAFYDNCLISFTLEINSTIYDNCNREYVVNVFISDRLNADSADLYNVRYELDGGKNNERNVSRYPIYQPKREGDTNCDLEMTEVELLNPEKLGYQFLGWFLDKDFTQQVFKFDNTITGNITLYAKWESIDANYYNIELSLKSVCDYNKDPKDLLDSLVYGDSIVLQFDFTPIYLLNYNSDKYMIQYYFYGPDVVGGYLVGNYKEFNLDFPKLTSGKHIFKIKVKVTINGVLDIEKETAIAVSVAQKMVEFGFENTSKVYNGKTQAPDVLMKQDFYPEDYSRKDKSSLFKLVCDTESKNVKKYNFYVKELNNPNYTFDKESDSSKCVFEITKRGITLEWKDSDHIYDGNPYMPKYELVNIVSGDMVTFSITVIEYNGVPQYSYLECKNAGIYKVNILPESISNSNYTVSSVASHEFEIKKAEIKVVMHNTTDRIQTNYEKRKVPGFTVIGNYHSVGDLQIVIINEAKLASRSGTYEISCKIENVNYKASVQKATYTLTGYYNVYYMLSNGNGYTERVEEGQDPTGVTKNQLGLSPFSKISYSDNFVVTGNDLYVEVEHKDYSFIAYTGIIALIGGVIAFVIYLKKRESNVR